ncbi:hypothetical protein HPB48_025445 [Haemaphysalis longicornis]|uniref:RING-type domain-containing protein n=1 Tax=Haemaphysalis longicornis TaxID=44386 RepID=A0A9J6GZ10_HAELO|nr:hypothetical protein HPB48_025445 [Haemaphysalis longicornis]
MHGTISTSLSSRSLVTVDLLAIHAPTEREETRSPCNPLRPKTTHTCEWLLLPSVISVASRIGRFQVVVSPAERRSALGITRHRPLYKRDHHRHRVAVAVLRCRTPYRRRQSPTSRPVLICLRDECRQAAAGRLRKLPLCGHVFCPLCYEKFAQKGAVCPVDRRSFAEQAVTVLDSAQGGIEDLSVRCPNAPRGCRFVSNLCELPVHLLEQCTRGKVHCPRCGRSMPQTEALHHYIQYCPRKAKDEGTSQKTSKTPLKPKYDRAATPDRSSRVDSSLTPGCNRSTSWRSLSLDSSLSKVGQRGPKSGVDVKLRQVCSADATPAAGIERAATPAAAKQKLRCVPVPSATSLSGSSIRSFPSIISSQIPFPVKTGSSTISGSLNTARASKSSESITTVPSQEAHFLKKLNSAVTKVQKTPPVARAEDPSTSRTGLRTSSTTVPAASTAAQPRKELSSDGAGKKAATAVLPAGFALCHITGLTGAESSLPTCGEVVLRSDNSLVADCAFRVHARLRRSAFGTTHACLRLCICGGTRETIAWLLTKRLYVVLVHPSDQSRNVRMALAPNPDAVHEEGRRAGRWDFWLPTNEVKLSDVESRGFLSSGAICIAVEIE